MAAGGALSLIKAVLELVAERRTGVLEVRADGVRTQITFDAGKPVFAEDEAPGESFGRLLMRQGVITNDQFVRVIDVMTRDIPTISHRRWLDEAFRILQEKSAPAVGVVDPDGKLIGLITSETIGEMLMVREALPAGVRFGPWSRPAGACSRRAPARSGSS